MSGLLAAPGRCSATPVAEAGGTASRAAELPTEATSPSPPRAGDQGASRRRRSGGAPSRLDLRCGRAPFRAGHDAGRPVVSPGAARGALAPRSRPRRLRDRAVAEVHRASLGSSGADPRSCSVHPAAAGWRSAAAAGRLTPVEAARKDGAVRCRGGSPHEALSDPGPTAPDRSALGRAGVPSPRRFAWRLGRGPGASPAEGVPAQGSEAGAPPAAPRRRARRGRGLLASCAAARASLPTAPSRGGPLPAGPTRARPPGLEGRVVRPSGERPSTRPGRGCDVPCAIALADGAGDEAASVRGPRRSALHPFIATGPSRSGDGRRRSAGTTAPSSGRSTGALLRSVRPAAGGFAPIGAIERTELVACRSPARASEAVPPSRLSGGSEATRSLPGPTAPARGASGRFAEPVSPRPGRGLHPLVVSARDVPGRRPSVRGRPEPTRRLPPRAPEALAPCTGPRATSRGARSSDGSPGFASVLPQLGGRLGKVP